MIDDGDYSLHKERSYKDNYYIARGSMELLIAQLRDLEQLRELLTSTTLGVLIDLPFDVQAAEIEFDPETYQPLQPYKPAATRAQIEKAISMLNQAERPLIVCGGGAQEFPSPFVQGLRRDLRVADVRRLLNQHGPIIGA